MSLSAMKQDVHDRLWGAQQRWFALREQGQTKHGLKMQGIRECGDPNRCTRNLIFAGSTRLTYERTLKEFAEYAHREHGAARLVDVGKKEFRAFMDRAIAEGRATKTLNLYRSAIAKLGALTGQTESFAAISKKYGEKIRELKRAGVLQGPARQTPTRDVVERTIAVLRGYDARHWARTGEPRAYHLAAQLQLETAARSISATSRVTAESLREGNQIELVGKGGRRMVFTLSPELHRTLAAYLALYPGPLARQRGYQSSYARAIQAAGGRVTGTHGARRMSAKLHYLNRYRAALRNGMTPGRARAVARGDAVEFLGHSRDRRDSASCYLGR